MSILRILAVSLFLMFSVKAFSQGLESGPMIGYVEHREALIWIAVDSTVDVATIQYWPESGDKSKKSGITKKIEHASGHISLSFILPELEINTRYAYEIILDGKKVSLDVPSLFTTKDLWEWRKPAPDMSFIFGSCAYINDSLYDRPGKKYGQSLQIFESMAKAKADFNLWGGDNLYFREVDYSSASGLAYRYSKDRRTPELKALLAVRPNYALWDDHDYGPNDGNRSFGLKDESRKLFTSWWGNNTYGEHGEGIYSKFTWSDCDFFILDDRWFRSANGMIDSVDGRPNPDKVMFGAKQLTWLKDAILMSRATFKFVVSGGQVLNPVSPYECLYGFRNEYNELMSFLDDHKIEGVVFLSGDRHMSELLKIDREKSYPFYEFTCSPLSSGVYRLTEKDVEFENPYRVKGSLISENNYSKVSVTGEKKNRMLLIEVFDRNNKPLWKHTIQAADLRYKK